MSAIVAPISVGTVNGKPLRFFRSPRPGGAPDLPWHSADDLHACLVLPRDVRRKLQRLNSEWRSPVVTVATTDGICTVAPHYTAQGIIGAAVELGMVPATVERDYINAGAAALKALMGDLPAIAAVEYGIAAFRNSGGDA